MARYMTRQRRMLLSYLSDHADETLSAAEIAEALGSESISVSAVYRNLSALEEEGLLKGSHREGSRESYYQYTAAPSCREQLHLMCKSCGRMFHMDSGGAELLIRSIAEKEGFQLDKSETVLFGLCRGCQGSEKGGVPS